MKLNRFVSLLSLISGVFLLASTCGAQDLVYSTNAASAFARAKAEGKMILTEFGRPACTDCQGMQSYFQKLSPPLKQWILASCILWNADIDHSSEYLPYVAGLTAYSLPVMCFVDPSKPNQWTARYTGLVPATTMFGYIKGQALKNLPLVVTNLPGAPVSNADFVVKGVARTNAAFVGSISNIPITAVWWRLNGSGSFQPAVGTYGWSAAASLAQGTNTFECYVQYGTKNSWTNVVTLINLGSGGTSLQSQTITFNSLAPQTYGVAPITLTATASSGLPVTFTVTSGPANISGSYLNITGAGQVSVEASQAGDGTTYSAAPSAPQTFMVNKVVLTVTANNASRNAGAPNPSFTASYLGFVNGETPSVLSGSPSLTTTATTGSGPGSYTITVAAGTLSAANYSFSFVNGTLTVNSLVPGDTNGNGIVDQAELNAVLAHYWASSPPYISNIAIAGKTNFTFTITNFTFTVQFTTNLANPNWQNLGQARFQFTDTNAVIGQQRYYRLVTP
jgi:hypothetical protein